LRIAGVGANPSVIFNSTQHLAALNISGTGAATLAAGSGRVLVTKALSTTGSGRLDLTDNAMILDYSGATPLLSIQAGLVSGYNGGLWTGTGIRSSIAAATPGTALGFAEATDLYTSFPAAFARQSIDNTSIVVRYTLAGDANLDKHVDTIDFNLLAGSFGVSGKRWFNADFDYNGTVNTIDFNQLVANFSKSMPAPDAAAALPRASVFDAARRAFARLKS